MSNLLLLTSLDSTEVFALGMTVSLHTKGFSASLYVIPSSVAGAHPRDRLTAPSFARPPLRLSVRALSDWKGCASGGACWGSGFCLSCCLQLVSGVGVRNDEDDYGRDHIGVRVHAYTQVAYSHAHALAVAHMLSIFP